jgi:hypothetical protein
VEFFSRTVTHTEEEMQKYRNCVLLFEVRMAMPTVMLLLSMSAALEPAPGQIYVEDELQRSRLAPAMSQLHATLVSVHFQYEEICNSSRWEGST